MTNEDMFEDVYKIVDEFDRMLRQEFKNVDITTVFFSHALEKLYYELQEEYKVENVENMMIDMMERTIRKIIREFNEGTIRGHHIFRFLMRDWSDNSSLQPYLDKEIEELINRKVIKFIVQSQMIVEAITQVNDEEEFNKYMLSRHLTNDKKLVLNKIASDIAHAFKRKFLSGNQQEV